MATSDKFRVLIDWNGDGFMNVGVRRDLTPNLVPNPYFIMRSNIWGTTISGHEEPTIRPTVVKDVDDDLGAQYASIPVGGSDALRIFVGYRQTKNGMPLPDDIKSLASGGSNGMMPSTTFFPNGAYDEFIDTVKMKNPYGEYAFDKYISLAGQTSSDVYYGRYGVIAGSNTGTDPSFRSFFVTAGLTYRINYYTKSVSGGSSNPHKAVVVSTDYNIGNNPPFTALATNATVATADDGAWHKQTITFTVPAGISKVALLIRTPGAGSQAVGHLYIAGVGLYISTDNPSYNADPAVNSDDNQFLTGKLLANTAYTYSVYVKSGASLTKVGLKAQGVDFDTSTWTLLQAEQQTTISGSVWTRITASFTTGANPMYALLQIIPYVGSNPASAGVTGVLFVRSAQLTQGTLLQPFHATLATAYENISDYVKSCDWKTGKRSVEEVLPYEGSFEMTLDNDSKIFSPANASSPLYGMFQQNRKVVIQVQNPTTFVWSNMWAGWIDSFSMDVGRTSNREAKILCKQGVYRLSEGDFSVPVAQFQGFKDIVTAIIKEGSWRSAANAYEGVLGYNMTLGETAYVQDTDAMFNLFNNGLNNYNLVGLDWGRNTKAFEALADVFNAENAGMWIDRDGLINIVNRNYWANRVANYDASLVLDTTVNKASYIYGENLINRMEVTYQPPLFNTNQVVWQTKNAAVMAGNKDRTIAMVFSLPEGRIKTVQNIQDALVLSVYGQNIDKYPNAPLITDSAITGNIYHRVNKVGSRYYLYLKNNNKDTYFIMAQINGDFVSTGDQVAGTFQDRDSISQTVSIHKKTLSNPIISTTEQAEAVATFYVSRNAFPIGNFSSITIVDDDTQANFDLIQSLKMGAIVRVTETQTQENNILAAIVEENGTLNGGSFTYTATLCKLDGNGYAQLDLSTPTVESSNGAINCYPVATRGAIAALNADGTYQLNTDVLDGWFYLIDNALTVRNFYFEDRPPDHINRQPSLSYRNVKHKHYQITGGVSNCSYWGSKSIENYLAAQNLVVPVRPQRVLPAYVLTSATQAPDIVIEPETYYMAMALGNYKLGYSGQTFTNGSTVEEMFQAYIDQVTIDSNANSNFSGFPIVYSTAEIWGTAAGVRYIGQGSCISHSAKWQDWDDTAGTQYFFTRPMGATAPTNAQPDIGRKVPTSVGFVLAGAIVGGMTLVKMSGLNNMPIDSTKSYKLAVWLQASNDSQTVNYTFEALDENHAVIASTTGNAGSTVGKLEVSIPTGHNFVTGRLRKTSANTENIDNSVTLYKTTLTETSLNSYLDLPAVSSYLYI